MSDDIDYTPIVKEFFSIYTQYKEKYGKIVLFYQNGTFYENYTVMTDEINIGNGNEIAKLLGFKLPLKSRKREHGMRNPYLCGCKVDKIHSYIRKILNENYVVIVYSQSENDKTKRVLSNIYSPSLYIDDLDDVEDTLMLKDNLVNGITSIYLLVERALYNNKKNTDLLEIKNSFTVAFTYLETLTGKIKCYQITTDDIIYLYNNMYRFLEIYSSKEIIINIDDKNNVINKIDIIEKLQLSKYKYYIYINEIKKDFYDGIYQEELLNKIYIIKNKSQIIDILGLPLLPDIIICLCLLFQFIYEHNSLILKDLQRPEIIDDDSKLLLINNSIDQLNLLSRDKTICVFDIINKTLTSPGYRLLKERFLSPITSIETLNKRYDMIEIISDKTTTIKPFLKRIYDVEKLFRRISLCVLNPNELINVVNSLNDIYDLAGKLDEKTLILLGKNFDVNEIKNLINMINVIFDVDRAYDEKVKISMLNHEIIKQNIFPQVDELRQILLDKQSKINKHINFITNLFYDIKESSRKSKGKALSRKNPVVTLLYNGGTPYLRMTLKRWQVIEGQLPEEYITSLSTKKSGYEIKHNDFNNQKNVESINVMSKLKDLYKSILNSIYAKYMDLMKSIVTFISELDFYYSLATSCYENNFTRPTLIQSTVETGSFIEAKSLRHPIVEIYNERNKFITNDVTLNNESNSYLIYGINGSGKSVFLREVGIAVFLAQIGCFVPASKMTLAPFNKIISRVVYEDSISRSLSSFTYEMMELNTILERSNNYSLVIGDEICKGTGTLDSIAIVAASIIRLCNINTRFLFTTHLHNLSDLDEIKKIQSLKIKHFPFNFDEKGKLIYERKLKDGSGPSKYGIEVCDNLGMDNNFINECYNFRKKLMGSCDLLVNNKKSRYNHNLYMDSCSKCGVKIDDNVRLETHHIMQQKDADENGFIYDKENDLKFHKNKLHNIVSLCEKCHKEITIEQNKK
jgi:DNA mismatch repair protein MutS